MVAASIPGFDLGRYETQNTVLLTSFKRDGTPVGTPVHIAVVGEHAYFRSYAKAWKTKRIRRNPRVTIAPSTIRGTPTGPAVEARARILEGEERPSPLARSRTSTRFCNAG